MLKNYEIGAALLGTSWEVGALAFSRRPREVWKEVKAKVSSHKNLLQHIHAKLQMLSLKISKLLHIQIIINPIIFYSLSQVDER